MTTITLELPERIAREAQSAGLLEPGRLTEVLEGALRQEAAREFLGYSAKVLESGVTPLTESEVMAEVKAARDARRARQ